MVDKLAVFGVAHYPVRQLLEFLDEHSNIWFAVDLKSDISTSAIQSLEGHLMLCVDEDLSSDILHHNNFEQLYVKLGEKWGYVPKVECLFLLGTCISVNHLTCPDWAGYLAFMVNDDNYFRYMILRDEKVIGVFDVNAPCLYRPGCEEYIGYHGRVTSYSIEDVLGHVDDQCIGCDFSFWLKVGVDSLEDLYRLYNSAEEYMDEA